MKPVDLTRMSIPQLRDLLRRIEAVIERKGRRVVRLWRGGRGADD